MRTASVLALALGCYSPHFASDQPCNPNMPACPPGQQCVSQGGAFVCAAGTGSNLGSDAGNADDDGDGVPNSLDNCPEVPNPLQENEDKDMWGDACDLCPPFASTEQADADGDMVGDACDPNPAAPGDHFLLFEGFHHGVPSGSGWTTVGDVTAVGDSVVATSLLVVGGSAAGLAWGFTQGDQETVSTQVTIGSAGPEYYVGVADTGNAAGSGVACVILTEGTSELALIELPAGKLIAMHPLPIVGSESHQLTLERIATQYECEDFANGSSNAIGGISTFTSTAPQLGIAVAGTTAKFDWLMAVQTN